MAEPTRFERQSRRVHTSNSGIEIVREFYCEPYESHVTVLQALQGSVDNNGDRVLPAHDPFITNCYCTEAVAEYGDPRVVSNLPRLEAAGDLAAMLAKKDDLPAGVVGAKITAHYRPLITAYKSADAEKPDAKIFDYIDPTFTPGTEQLPWPNGTFVQIAAAGGKWSWGLDAYPKPFAVPVTDFSIRRLLVKEVPRDAINERLNCVNSTKWPFDKNTPTFDGLPQFEKETLKFVSADVQNRVDADGNRLYEITYHFRWITLEDELCDKTGQVADGTVTWNHAFMGPVGQPLAWYRVYRAEKVEGNLFGVRFLAIIPGAQIASGPLHKLVSFDELFQ